MEAKVGIKNYRFYSYDLSCAKWNETENLHEQYLNHLTEIVADEILAKLVLQ